MQGFVEGLAPFAARLAPLFARLGPALLVGLAALGPILLRGLFIVLRLLTGPVGWALLAAQLAYVFRAEIGAALSGLGTWLQERLKLSFGNVARALAAGPSGLLALAATRLAYSFRAEIGAALSALGTWLQERLGSLFGGISLADIGAQLMQSLLDGLKRAAESVMGWATGFVGRLKSLFSFSASPTITPKGGGASAPAAIPQSYRPTGLTPAPARQASVTFNNTFSVNGGADPEGAARRILAALDRQRQASLYDGALA